jgi:amino acid transporter
MVADKLGGEPFKIYLTLVGLVSALGMFNVLLCTSARSLYALAPDDLLGWPVLAVLHPKYKTPFVSNHCDIWLNDAD